MNMKKAARETLELAKYYNMDYFVCPPDLDYSHLEAMLDKMENTEMSEGKLGRWLGWMQAAVVASGIGVTLEDMKNINKKWS